MENEPKGELHQRREERFIPLDDRLPGTLVRTATGASVAAQCVNVSDHGLGIKSNNELDIRENLILRSTADVEYKLRIQWRLKADKEYRYGLYSLEEDSNLVNLFKKHGLVD